MALVLTDNDKPRGGNLFGMARFCTDPNNEKAEFAILLGREKTGLGLGPMLMRRILDFARTRGIRHIFGKVLNDNRSMLALCNALGFKRRCAPDDPKVTEVSLKL